MPQFTVDSHRAVGDFDLLGVSFSTELGYTNLLTALDLAGMPLHAADRSEDDPLVIAGGHAAFNPEPIADFIDAAVIGDGEQAVLTITDIVTDWKASGRPGGRHELLLRLARTGGVYVPAFYDVSLPRRRPDPAGRPAAGLPGVPWRVSKHTVMDLDAWPYPKQPLVPLAESVHERMSVEIFRGCTRGCRFCQAGMITRPVRERSITGIGEMVERGLAATGFEEVGLLSLSSADHSEIADITKGLADRYEGTQTGLSLPSTRVDAFNIDLANELTRNGRRSGLTFAPEGGSERIRKVINKMVTEEDLIATVSAAYGAGWRQVKLYFMCGLPTETDEDVLQIADLAKRVIETGRRVSGRRDIRCTVSIGGFVPKPHTPFQWVAQLGAEETDARLAKLRDAIRSDRRYASAIGFRYHDGQPGIVEGLLSRGDRRIGKVIEAVWRDGGRFDGWSEHFSYERWMRCAAEALAEGPVDVAWYTTRDRDQSEVLPWDHLDSGPRQGVALGGLAGRPGRDRGGRLPVDAVLRLRGVPADGHRHRGRPDGQDPAAAHRARRGASGAGRDPLTHRSPGLRRPPGRCADRARCAFWPQGVRRPCALSQPRAYSITPTTLPDGSVRNGQVADRRDRGAVHDHAAAQLLDAPEDDAQVVHLDGHLGTVGADAGHQLPPRLDRGDDLGGRRQDGPHEARVVRLEPPVEQSLVERLGRPVVVGVDGDVRDPARHRRSVSPRRGNGQGTGRQQCAATAARSAPWAGLRVPAAGRSDRVAHVGQGLTQQDPVAAVHLAEGGERGGLVGRDPRQVERVLLRRAVAHTGTTKASATACCRGSWNGVTPGVGKYSATVNGCGDNGIRGIDRGPRSFSTCRISASRMRSW